MATIDPRITPLIETLIASGAGSLALEILSEIQHGRIEETTEEELGSMREEGPLRKGHRTNTFYSVNAEVRHLSGDEQIGFAAEYAIERITQSLQMVEGSLVQLDRIAADAKEVSALAQEQRLTAIRLRSTDSEELLSREQIGEAKGKLPALREALRTWSVAARRDATDV